MGHETRMALNPMGELLAALRANDPDTFSGGRHLSLQLFHMSVTGCVGPSHIHG